MTRPALSYTPGIDGLRALAVLAVMVYHLRPTWLPGGFLGVDVFFVVSGFVVSGALPVEASAGLRQLIGFFYARRAARILPALYLAVLLATLGSALFIPESWLSGASTSTAQGALRGYSNFVLANNDNDYFAPRTEYNPFTHTWSLGVEEQFYVLFPFLFYPWLRGRRRMSAWLFGIAGAVSLAWAAVHSASGAAGNFYLIFGRFWELALGVLSFQTRVRVVPRSVMGGALAVLVGSFCFSTTTPWPGSMLPCGATAVLLVGLRAGSGGLLVRALTNRAALYVGKRSYSLYLWHWPVYVLFRWSYGLVPLEAALVAPTITFALADASYRFVEEPPRRALGGGRIRPRTVLVAAAALVLLTGPAQKSLWGARQVISFASPSRHPEIWYPDTPIHLAGPCQVQTGRASVAEGIAFTFRREGCPAPARPAATLFVLGDSHAGAYTNLIRRFVYNGGSAARLYVRGGCALLGQLPDEEGACATYQQAALADVSATAVKGDILFLPGLRIPRIADQFVIYGLDQAIAKNESVEQQVWRTRDLPQAARMLAPLYQRGLRIILEAPKPEFASPAFRCADWFNHGNAICAGGHDLARAILERLSAPVLLEFQSLSRQLPEIRIWNPSLVLCPGEVCSAYAADGVTPLFFDADHLSGAGDAVLEPDFERFLAKVRQDGPAPDAGNTLAPKSVRTNNR